MTRFDHAFAPIAVATRSDFEESLHHGAAVALDAGGSIIAAVGDPTVAVYPRSALKPLQAAAMVDLGLELPDDLLAIVCASHDGSTEHLRAVRRILELFDLGLDALGNTASLPLDPAAREVALRDHVAPSPLQQNCSGKHAGMLATCRINGWSTDDYLERDHPLQQAITAAIQARAGHVHHIGLDGCGAPTHVVALDDLARAFASIATSGSSVSIAMTSRPDLVGGPTRDVTRWMESLPGLVMKDGADGVMAGALPDGRAFALKVAGSHEGARRAASAQALRALGVDIDAEAPDTVEQTRPIVWGLGRVVGHIDGLPWGPWSS